MSDLQALLREAAELARNGGRGVQLKLAAKLEAAAENMGEPVAYEHVAECQYGDVFPCNPACCDSGWCHKRRLTAPPPAPAVPEGWMRNPEEVKSLAEHLESVGWSQDEQGGIQCTDQGAAMAAEVVRTVLMPLLAAAGDSHHE